MKIRPRNIPIFQYGGGVPQWYIDRYGNRTKLLGWDLNQRYNYANKNLNTNDHRNAGNLDTVYRKNLAYIRTPGAISSDIQTFYNSDGQGMSAQDFVNFYNKNAQAIRNHWATDQTYNAKTAGDHNKLFKRMFASRSDQGMSPGSDYNIGYQNDLEDIEGSSTWLRRMDQYENEFDPNNPDSNRIHEITLSNGQKARVYKKANGDIALLNSPDQNNPDTPLNGGQLPEVTITPNNTQVPASHKERYRFDWNKIKEAGAKIFGNPDLYALGRLAGNIYNNERVYDEQLKGIKPVLRQTYNTHRQVVGDEATKQAYYRRAAQGQTKAARPFTSDADKQMAYQFEAKRVGDELRAQGDLADNQEIRRTSDESNQHQWANQQRATEVANANIASMNQANALKHNLLAQKHSAQWSSVDNFLKGIEYRKRQQLANQQALDDQIFALQQQQELENDPRILQGQRELQNVLDKHKINGGYDYNNEEVKAAIRNWKALQTQVTIDSYRRRAEYYRNRDLISFSKSGTKITRKRKDDLLYKSARDVVEHFRKMSKISSDAQNRKTPKIEKLTSHPKGKTRRYQQGGVAPFTVYTPVALGGETSSQVSTSSGNTLGTSSGKSDGKETLDMIKKLFEQIVGKGLPSDVSNLYEQINNLFAKSRAFGTELSTDDIASMYISQMQELNTIQYLKDNFDKAKETMISNDAVNEVAVNAIGQLAAQDSETGKIEYVDSVEDARKKGLHLLSNSQIADMRSLSPELAGRTDLDAVLANGVGMTKIASHIKNLIPTIGTDKLTQEGYTKVQAQQIQKGFELLLGEAPEGDYEFQKQTESQKRQREAALGYITAMLPKNMKAVLKANADLQGIPTSKIIEALVMSGDSTLDSLTFSPVTGKAAKESKNGEGGDGIDSDKIKTNPLLAMQREMGGTPQRYEIVTKDSNTRMAVNGTFYSAIPKVKDDTSIDSMLSQSGIDGILDSKYGITFGDQQINPENLKDIMYSNTGGMVVTLPCKIVNGHKQVNLAVRESYEKAEQEALAQVGDRQSPQFQKVLGDKLKEHHLDSLLDSTGRPNRKMFAQFLVVEAYTTDKVKFDTKSQYVEKVQNPDDSLEQRMSKALSTNDKKNDYSIDSKNHWFEMFYDDIYRGTVFIPLNNNPNSAMNSWGNSDLKIDQSQDLEELYQLYNKSANYKNNNSFE